MEEAVTEPLAYSDTTAGAWRPHADVST